MGDAHVLKLLGQLRVDELAATVCAEVHDLVAAGGAKLLEDGDDVACSVALLGDGLKHGVAGGLVDD